MCYWFNFIWISHLVVFEIFKQNLFAQKQPSLHSLYEVLEVIGTSVSCMIFYNKVNKPPLLLRRLWHFFSYLIYLFKILLRLHFHYFQLCSLISHYCSRHLILMFHFICYSLLKVECILAFRSSIFIRYRCLLFVRSFFNYRVIFMNRHQRGGADFYWTDLTPVL